MTSNYRQVSDAVDAYAEASRTLGRAKGYGDGTDFAIGGLRGLLALLIDEMPEPKRQDQIDTLARWTRARMEEAIAAEPR